MVHPHGCNFELMLTWLQHVISVFPSHCNQQWSLGDSTPTRRWLEVMFRCMRGSKHTSLSSSHSIMRTIRHVAYTTQVPLQVYPCNLVCMDIQWPLLQTGSPSLHTLQKSVRSCTCVDRLSPFSQSLVSQGMSKRSTLSQWVTSSDPWLLSTCSISTTWPHTYMFIHRCICVLVSTSCLSSSD